MKRRSRQGQDLCEKTSSKEQQEGDRSGRVTDSDTCCLRQSSAVARVVQIGLGRRVFPEMLRRWN